MANKFYSYIDDFNKITIIVPYAYRNENITFLLSDGKIKIELTTENIYDFDSFKKFQLSCPDMLSLHRDYLIFDDFGETSYLRIGSVTRKPLFDMLYFYDGDLGVNYSEKECEFILYTPVSKEVELELIDQKDNRSFHNLVMDNTGCYRIKIKKDLEGYKYRYNIRVNENFVSCLDPYAVASNANGTYNYIIDWEKTHKFKNAKPYFSGNKVDMIIYEAHIRDLTSKSNLPKNIIGTYRALLEEVKTKNDNSTALEHIAALGITHLQLLPFFDFGGVDEINKEKKYNWGYNPEQFNVPEGWYASDAENPYSRINELRMLIDKIHGLNMRVSMDVVFNHVHYLDTFSLQKLIPGYVYRYDSHGIRTNTSGCGNDLATERKMIRKFIKDSIRHWMNFYQIDAFRFDLMGLIDIQTINEVYSLAKAIDNKCAMYGEGWNMPSVLPEEERASQKNNQLIPYIGQFNDIFRNAIRGDIFKPEIGFAGNGQYDFYRIINCFKGSPDILLNPNLSINYLECHDNRTFYDHLKIVFIDLEEKKIRDIHQLGTQIILLSQGVPFLHAGQEFYRSKKGIENSYMDNDEINGINWEEKDCFIDYTEMIKDLIRIRKEYKEFRMLKKVYLNENFKVRENLSDLNHLILDLISFSYTLRLVVKNNYQKYTLKFNKEVINIFDGRSKSDKSGKLFELNFPAIYLYKMEE